MAQFTQFTTPAKTYANNTIPRLSIAADGLPKSGKTHWALMTTPEPVVVVTTDTGTRAIVEKANKAGRNITGVMECVWQSENPNVRSHTDIDKREHEAQKKAWKRFEDFCESLHTDKTVRTLVIDKANNINNLLELSFFGKLKGNQTQNVRTDMNSAFHKLFWDLYKARPDLNMIWIHDHKKAYTAAGTWTGKYEREGHSKIGGYVDMTLDFGWDSTCQDFYTQVSESNPLRYMTPDSEGNFQLGQKWYSKDPDNPSHFGYLAMKIFPETELDPGYWGLK